MPVLALLFALLTLPPSAHEFHVSYGDMAVEQNQVVLRLRFFQDDLEMTLRGFHGDDTLQLAATPEADARFLGYLNAYLTLTLNGTPAPGRVLGSGEDMLDREPVWWFVVQFEADAPIEKLYLRNRLLLDLFDDQKNIVKIVHFPEETSRTYYFAKGEDSAEVDF